MPTLRLVPTRPMSGFSTTTSFLGPITDFLAGGHGVFEPWAVWTRIREVSRQAGFKRAGLPSHWLSRRDGEKGTEKDSDHSWALRFLVVERLEFGDWLFGIAQPII
jgi:hypothetical protein